jgi:hypothetical protein
LEEKNSMLEKMALGTVKEKIFQKNLAFWKTTGFIEMISLSLIRKSVI